MGLGHMFFDRGEPASMRTTGMAGHAPALAEDFNHGLCNPHVHFLSDELVRNAVAVAFNFDVVIDVNG